jgi:predicted lipid-binding transport protein (Tim44 family)
MAWLKTHSRSVWLLVCLVAGPALAAYGYTQDPAGSMTGRALGGLLGGAGLGLIAWSRSAWLDVRVVAGAAAFFLFLSLVVVSISSGRGSSANLLFAIGVPIVIYLGITRSVRRGD